jgi:hypothetical protein
MGVTVWQKNKCARSKERATFYLKETEFQSWLPCINLLGESIADYFQSHGKTGAIARPGFLFLHNFRQ